MRHLERRSQSWKNRLVACYCNIHTMNFVCFSMLMHWQNFWTSYEQLPTAEITYSNYSMTLHKDLTSILNVEISNDQWSLYTLLVHLGGLGMRSAMMLVTSAFLASAASTFSLQNGILEGAIQVSEDPYTSEVKASWKSLPHVDILSKPANRYQKVWDAAVSTVAYEDILSRYSTTVDKARLEGCQSSACWRLVECSSCSICWLKTF